MLKLSRCLLEVFTVVLVPRQSDGVVCAGVSGCKYKRIVCLPARHYFPRQDLFTISLRMLLLDPAQL